MTRTKKKYIGFELVDTKDKIYETMLKSIIDFTIPGSTCNLFYKLKTGEILNKTYFKLNTNLNFYYINGDTYKDKNGKYINNIFRKVKDS